MAGLSMGGYGAWHVALSKPEQFAAAASLSGALMFPYGMEDRIKDPKAPWPFQAIFNSTDVADIAQTETNLFVQIKKLQEQGVALPKLFQTVGTEDFTYQQNQTARRELEKLHVEYTYEEAPGIHDWDYWDTHIQHVLNWLPLANTTV